MNEPCYKKAIEEKTIVASLVNFNYFIIQSKKISTFRIIFYDKTPHNQCKHLVSSDDNNNNNISYTVFALFSTYFHNY